MQAIHKDKDEEGDSRRVNPIGPLIYAGRIDRYLEREYFGGLRSWEGRI